MAGRYQLWLGIHGANLERKAQRQSSCAKITQGDTGQEQGWEQEARSPHPDRAGGLCNLHGTYWPLASRVLVIVNNNEKNDQH